MNPSENEFENVFEDPSGKPFSGKNFLKIDCSVLIRRPLATNLEYYLVLARTVTSLKISRVPEGELKMIFDVFASVENLTLKNIFMLSCWEVNYLPKNLKTLSLIDCRIMHQVVVEWFKANKFSLKSVRISRLFCALSLCGVDSANNVVDRLRFVKHMTIKGAVGLSLEFIQPNLVYLCHDSPAEDMDRFLNTNYSKETLKTLVLSHLPRNVLVFRLYPNLDHLKVISPLTLAQKIRLELVKDWKILSVSVKESEKPPKEENLILKLPNHLLVKIISLLPPEYWLKLMNLHPKFQEVIEVELLPNADLTIDYLFISRATDLLFRLGPSARSLVLKTQYYEEILSQFLKIDSLTLNEPFLPHVMDLIPNGLKELKVKGRNSPWTEVEVEELFERLDGSLTHLEKVGFAGLDKLNHIVSLDLSVFEFHWQFEEFMEHNSHNLEVLKLTFYQRKRRFVVGVLEPYQFEFMSRLRVLHIHNLHYYLGIIGKNLPFLEELVICFHKESGCEKGLVNDFMRGISSLTTLQTLFINFRGMKWNLSTLFALRRRLKRLSVSGVDQGDLLQLAETLTSLEELGVPKDFYSLEFEGKLRAILYTKRRNLWIYKTGENWKEEQENRRKCRFYLQGLPVKIVDNQGE